MATDRAADLAPFELPARTGGRGWFVVFEGGEGCGKSTQARLLAQRCGALLTHEPGGTRLGTALRRLLLDHDAGDLDRRAEALLMAADRAQHVAESIRPSLEAGRAVVCDRYLGSSVAYQGHGRGLDPGEIRDLSLWATGDLEPDVVVYLVVGENETLRRTGAPRDAIEAAGAEFHHRVRQGFESQAEADPDRWVRVDGSGTVPEVAERVSSALRARLRERS
ncbi:MAG: dTMP kinase [Microthrixaceae bacterium]|nr:dTMP kinase [Microthrixaceae bacterium]